MWNLDFLKVLRFTFSVPVVGPSFRSLSRFCRRNTKNLPLALRAREKILARLVGKSIWNLTVFFYKKRQWRVVCFIRTHVLCRPLVELHTSLLLFVSCFSSIQFFSSHCSVWNQKTTSFSHNVAVNNL